MHLRPLASGKEFRKLIQIHCFLSSHAASPKNSLPEESLFPFQESSSETQQLSNNTEGELGPIVFNTKWFALQYVFLLVRAIDLGMQPLVKEIERRLVKCSTVTPLFALNLKGIIMIVSDLLGKMEPSDENEECQDEHHFSAKECHNFLQELITKVDKCVPEPIHKTQMCFFGNLRCIATHLIRSINVNRADIESADSVFRRMLGGVNFLLHKWAAKKESSPIIPHDGKTILNIVIDKCQLFPTRSACPFLLLIEVSHKNSPKAHQVPIKTPPAENSPEEVPSSNMSSPLNIESLFGRSLADQMESVRRESSHSGVEGWSYESVLVKHADGMLQEIFMCQLIGTIARLWENASIPLKVRPYYISAIDDQFALVEFIQDAKTIDFIKRSTKLENGNTLSLSEIFTKEFFEGATDNDDTQSVDIESFTENFISSCAGYSVINYVLQISDRHNKNVLLTRDGRIVHVDFGFVLEETPGGIAMESWVPFKLPLEYIEFMGERGLDRFRELVLLGMTVLRQNIEHVAALIEIGNPDCLPCLGGSARIAAERVRDRAGCNANDELDFSDSVIRMIDSSIGSWITRGYDMFQRIQNDIQS